VQVAQLVARLPGDHGLLFVREQGEQHADASSVVVGHRFLSSMASPVTEATAFHVPSAVPPIHGGSGSASRTTHPFGPRFCFCRRILGTFFGWLLVLVLFLMPRQTLRQLSTADIKRLRAFGGTAGVGRHPDATDGAP